MFKQIIVAVDGSEQSQSAAWVACDLARHYAGALTLMHVPHRESWGLAVGAVAGYRAATSEPTMAELEQAGQQILEDAMKVIAEQEHDQVKTHMQNGDPAAEVLAYADQIGADLIVTGRRGLGKIKSLVLGSTTQKINHSARCACLSVV